MWCSPQQFAHPSDNPDMTQDMPTWTAAVVALAQRAGLAIMHIYAQPDAMALQHKADASPVTAADLAAHRVIVEGLTAITPDVPVVSEEDSDSHGLRTRCARYWLIDPLDGTKEFIARNGEFTVNIALIEHGFATWGVVHAPSLGETFWGGRGLGTWQGDASQPQAMQVQALGAAPLRVVASKSHLNAETQGFIAALGEVTVVQAGSSLKLCRIAQGRADLYPRLSPTCEWDTAAAQAVVEGAGGWVTDLAGQRLRCGKPDVLNPSFVVSATAPGVHWTPRP